MKAIIRIHLKQFFTKKLLFLIIGCLLFSIGERQTTSGSYELYVLNMLTEHYYLTYMMIPTYLLLFYQSLEHLPEFVLIRTEYFWKSFLARVVATFINAFSFVGIQIIIFLIVGIGLKSSNQFPTSFSVENEVAYFFGQYFQTPVMAIIIVALFMGIGLFTVSVAILAFHHFFDEKITLAVLIFLYIFMTFGIKIPNISQIPFVFIDNYIILHHNFSYQGKLLVTIISMLIIYVVVYVLVKRYWQQQPNLNWKWRRKGIASFYARYLFTRKNILICFSVISVISLWKASNTASFEETSLKDYYLMLFYGHGSNEFHLLSFLEMMIMNSVPLYLLAIYLEEEKQDRNLAITVRLRQRVFWLNAIIGNSMAFIAFYVFCLIMTGSLVGVVFGFEGRATIMALNIALLKFLDISLQFLLMFFLFTFNRNITMAFLGVLAINIMSIWFRYVPTGISSIARGEEMGGLSFAMRLSILLISQLIIWIFIRSVSYKKIFQ